MASPATSANPSFGATRPIIRRNVASSGSVTWIL